MHEVILRSRSAGSTGLTLSRGRSYAQDMKRTDPRQEVQSWLFTAAQCAQLADATEADLRPRYRAQHHSQPPKQMVIFCVPWEKNPGGGSLLQPGACLTAACSRRSLGHRDGAPGLGLLLAAFPAQACSCQRDQAS